MIEIKAPQPFSGTENRIKVFLAGSIEMGKAEKWQDRLIKDLGHHDVVFLNPRRDDWDSSWVQSIDNPQFNEQVTWELSALEAADVRIFYFDPNTTSPITLLELGLHSNSTFTRVCCPPGYFRKGNIDITCDYYVIPVFNTYEDFVSSLDGLLGTLTKMRFKFHPGV